MADKKAPEKKVDAKVDAKAEADKQAAAEAAAEAARKSVRDSAAASLSALRASIITPPALGEKEQKEPLFKEAAKKVGKLDLKFTKDTQEAFFKDILTKAQNAYKDEKDDAKKDKMAALYADSVSEGFVTTFVKDYYFLLADGVAGDIALDVGVDTDGKITIKADQKKIEEAQKTVDSKAAETVAANPQQSDEMGRFQKEHPEAFAFLSAAIFKGKDDKEMKEAFAGKGFFGFLLGLIGYGGGKSIYGAFMKNKSFSKYFDGALDSGAELSPYMDFRKPVELDKDADLKEFYDKLPSNEFRTVKKRFLVKNDIVLPEMTTFGYIKFPKGSTDKITIDKASKDGGSTSAILSFGREEYHEKITVPKGTKLEAGTTFANITIGDKIAIEAAQSGVVAPKKDAAEASPAASASKPVDASKSPAVQPKPTASTPDTTAAKKAG